MTVPITTATSAIASQPSTGSGELVNPNGKLGQNDFLKLMVAQLQSQNPLKPSSNNEYINELAKFTEVEQVTNLAGSSELSGAVQLIGHEVTYKDSHGIARTGTVESVQTTTEGTTLTISGVPGIKELSVTEVS